MRPIAMWLDATRPKTLIASISPILLATCYAASLGFFNPFIFVSTLLTGMLIQIMTNLANDYFDGIGQIDTEKRIGPKRLTALGLVSHKTMKQAILLTSSLAFLISLHLIYVGGPIIFFLMILALALGILYTAGKFSFSRLGIGEFVAAFFIGGVGAMGSAYLQTGAFELKSFILGLGPGCFGGAVLCMNNLRDRETDLLAGRKTIPVRFGMKVGKGEYILFLVSAFLIPTLLTFKTLFSATILLIGAIPLIKSVIKAASPEDFIPLFPKTALLFIVYTGVFAYLLLL